MSRALAPARPQRIRLTINLPALVPGLGSLAGDKAAWLAIDDALVEDWGEGARVRIRGSTRLPDDAIVSSSLYFDDERAIGAETTTRGSRFEASMYWPAGTGIGFFSGIFSCEVSYTSSLVSPGTIEGWKTSRPEVDWDQVEIPVVRRKIAAGLEEESRAQDMEASAYYSRITDEARRLERALKSTLANRSDERRVFVSGAKPSMRPTREGEPWFQKDFLNQEGKLDEPRWRKFLDEEWRPAVQRLLDEHAKRGPEKYGRASTLVVSLLNALLEASYGYSKFVVYPSFGLPEHDNDFYADEERSADLVRLEKIIASSFEGLERYRSLGN